jgi:HK97 family phage portal protein
VGELSQRAAEIRRSELRKAAARSAARSVVTAPVRAVKALRRMTWTRLSGRSWFVPGSARRFHREVGDGAGNSAVQATLSWIARTFPEAPTALFEKLGAGEEELVDDHELVDLLRQPNPFYGGETLWAATLLDYHTDGDAYWLKIRRGTTSSVAQLWWVPHQLMEPKRDDDQVFITHYDYTPGGSAAPQRLEVEDVVHFRNGLDPDNPMKGRAPMRAVLAEVFTDEEAAAYTASILRNHGVPGLVIAPKAAGDASGSVPADDIKATKQYVSEAFTGDNRGGPLVLGDPVDVTAFGFNPDQMDLKSIRRVPEERITAVLGVPAIVVGLGAGLDRSTFANYAEAREAAYESRIIPDQRILAGTLQTQLLPDFNLEGRRFRIGFDLSDVRVLQEDEDRIHARAREDWKAGLITRARALRAIGEEAGPDDEVYMVATAFELLPAKEAGAAALQAELDAPPPMPALPPGPPVPPADANGNGNGAVPPQLVGAQ